MIRATESLRPTITRIVYIYLLLILIYQWYSLALPYQLHCQPVFLSGRDISTWLFRFSGLYSLLFVLPAGCVVFSLLLFLLPVLMVLFPRRHYLAIIYSALYVCYLYGLYSSLTHFEHILLGSFWIQIPFWSKKGRTFELLWEGIRYYSCWIFGSAFLWKIINGAIFQSDYGTIAFKRNYLWYLYQNPDSARTHLYEWFLNHPFILNTGDKITFLMEGMMLTGFFTKKADPLLITIWWAIIPILYFFADVNFWPLGILTITFIPVRYWQKWQLRIPALAR